MTDKQNYFTYTDNTSDNNDKTMENLHKQMDIGQCPYEGECQLCKSACSVDVYCFIKQLFDERNIAEEQLYLKNKECKRLKGKLLVTLGKTGLKQSEKEFYEQQLDQLKKRLRYYECDEAIVERDNYIEELLQTLTEIKDVLNFYANSKIGEQQEDGTYKILLNGDYITIYDPNPAKKALQKIKEVENE